MLINDYSLYYVSQIPCGSTKISANVQCSEPCGKTLSCGHLCLGSCSACLGGRLHVPCQDQCRRRLLCGHDCDGGTCGAPCEPCKKKKCLVAACGHKECRANCEDPCLTSCKVETANLLNLYNFLCSKKPVLFPAKMRAVLQPRKVHQKVFFYVRARCL